MSVLQRTGTYCNNANTILTFGPTCRRFIIQNNGTAAVRLSMDGGPTQGTGGPGKAGTDPTASTGYLLAAGQSFPPSWWGEADQWKTFGAKPIRAISANTSNTLTLDIITDDADSS